MPSSTCTFEGCKAARNIGIGQAADLIEVLTEHIHRAVAEIGREQYRPQVRHPNRQHLVDGTDVQGAIAIRSVGRVINQKVIARSPAAGFQPAIVPSSVANRKVAGWPSLNMKAFRNQTEGLPSGSGGVARWRRDRDWWANIQRHCTVLDRESTLASPAPLSEIQNGLVGENEMPQALTRLGSVACAGIDPSE